MKRISVAIDEQLLEQALAVSGEKTYARAIDRALRELVRRTAAGSSRRISLRLPVQTPDPANCSMLRARARRTISVNARSMVRA